MKVLGCLTGPVVDVIRCAVACVGGELFGGLAVPRLRLFGPSGLGVTGRVDDALGYVDDDEIDLLGRLELDGVGAEYFNHEFDLDIESEAELEALRRVEQVSVVQEDLWDGPDEAPDIYSLRATASTPACPDLRALLRHEVPGIDGQLVFSSAEAMETLCIALRMLAAGYEADVVAPMKPNAYTIESDSVSMSDAPTRNVYDWVDFAWRNGNPYGIPQAWEALEAHGRTEADAPGISVADRGFIASPDLMASGQNLTPSGSVFGEDWLSYHGTRCAHTVFGTSGNNFGTSGTAGRFVRGRTVFRVKNSFQIRRAMRRAVRFRRAGDPPRPGNRDYSPAVLSISQSRGRPQALYFLGRSMARTARRSIDNRDLLIFASPENANTDLDNSRTVQIPCELGGVVCVGGVRRTDTALTRDGESNYGSNVELFAPYRGYRGPIPSDPINDMLGLWSGTSHSVPYVAGVAALVWTADPNLSANEVRDRLRLTAQVSADPTVTGVVSPYVAVISALPSTPPLVRFTRGGDEGTRVSYGGGVFSLGATAQDPTDGDLTPMLRWTSPLSGLLGTGPSVSWSPVAADIGAHVIEASAVDSSGLRTGEQVGIEVVNDPPVIVDINISPPFAVATGTLVTFEAIITDANEPTPFAPGRIQWISSLQGFLGFGATLERVLTVEGVHEITVTATDELGLSTTQHPPILIGVGTVPGQPSVSATVVEVSRTPTTLTLRLESTSSDPDGTVNTWVWTRLDTGVDVGMTEVVDPYTTPFVPCSTIPFRITVTDNDGNTASADTFWVDLC